MSMIQVLRRQPTQVHGFCVNRRAPAAGTVVDFACATYKVGLQRLRPVNELGQSLTFDSGECSKVLGGGAGGFATTELALLKVLTNRFYAESMSDRQMLSRVNEMDGQSQSLRAIAEKLQTKLNSCTEYDEVKKLTDKLKPMLKKFEADIDKL
jgi:hypothetical protein